jgi:hypothetical protein
VQYIPNKINCRRNLGKFLVNATESTFTNCPCKTYACADCGQFAKYRLQKALSHYLSQFKSIYFWTFTFRSTIFESIKQNHSLAPQIWRRFTVLMRIWLKSRGLLDDFKYIKVLELHKSGFIHYHVVFERFFPASAIRKMWHEAIKSFINTSETPGNVHAKVLKHANQAANYLAKYVVKAAKEIKQTLRKKTRLYSKTNNVILFTKEASHDSWHFENLKDWAANLEIHRISVLIERNLELKMEIIEQSCYKKYLFDVEMTNLKKWNAFTEQFE